MKDAINYTDVITPRIAVPIHYGAAVGKYEDAFDFKKSGEALKKDIQVKILIGI